ncbi:MAG: LCP family protein [Spirochaetaceae bacterium]|nr:LCP family protein [Spirochaetaceae bacterium]MCF7947989.1 LCP family protein [Spirochaetia bacterium]MCF7950880.1 LCP family protein [Spirochaetaceae bacterium]
MPKFRISKVAVFVFLIVAVLAAAGVFIYLQVRTDQVAATIEENQPLKFLLVLGDEGEIEFSEVVFYQHDTGKSALIDVPLQVGMLLEDRNKIGAVQHVFQADNPELYISHVEALLGTEIDYYLYIDRQQMVHVIDLLEGLDLFIPNPVEYRGENGIVLLPSGSVTLDGEKSMLYARYQEPNERGTERIGRRQKFVQSVFKKMGDKSQYLLNDKVRDTLLKNIRTDLSKRAAATLIQSFNQLDYDQVVFQRVLGNERQVDGETLLFPYYEGKLIKETVQQTLVSLRNREVVSTEELNVTLELLNGTSRNGLAGRTSQVFRSYGYDVARVGNAEEQDYEKTIVIDWSGDISAAQQLAGIIQCKNVESRVKEAYEAPTTAPGVDVVDVTIILGKDFDGRYCKE